MSKNNYWTREVDYAIEKYCRTDNQFERNQIFNESIYLPLLKLCQNVWRTFYTRHNITYFSDYDDSIRDCMSFLVTKFHLFDSKKSKGYSYFSIVCKNYYIQQSIKNYKKWGLSIEDSRGYYFNGPLRDTRKRKRVTFNPSYQSLEEQIYDELLPILTPSELRIKKPKHLKILEELRELLGQKNLQVHINNKKDLFERIRDKHRVNTQQIRQVILKMKKQYNRTKQRVINEQYKY